MTVVYNHAKWGWVRGHKIIKGLKKTKKSVSQNSLVFITFIHISGEINVKVRQVTHTEGFTLLHSHLSES